MPRSDLNSRIGPGCRDNEALSIQFASTSPKTPYTFSLYNPLGCVAIACSLFTLSSFLLYLFMFFFFPFYSPCFSSSSLVFVRIRTCWCLFYWLPRSPRPPVFSRCSSGCNPIQGLARRGLHFSKRDYRPQASLFTRTEIQ